MQTSMAFATAITLPQGDGAVAATPPAQPSSWRRMAMAYGRYIEKCQAARQAKVDRAIREGLTQWY